MYCQRVDIYENFDYAAGMIITNKFGVPDVIWRAASNDKYSRGLADISVTQLIDAPQISVLRDRYKDELSQDATERMWSLLGTAVHSLLEHAADTALVEERLFLREGPLVLSGAVDVQEEEPDGSISVMDFKVTGASSVMWGKDSWHKQLNMYALLIRRNKGKRVGKLQICAILRDWKRSELIRDQRYPKSPIVVIDIPVWSDEKQDTYLAERIDIHHRAREGEDIPCTPDERWERGEKWAVLKTLKSKRSVRNFPSEKEAIDYSINTEYIVQHRPGVCARCEQDFCGVAKWCKQFNDLSARTRKEPEDDWL